MVASFPLLKSCPWCSSTQFGREHKGLTNAFVLCNRVDKLKLRKPLIADSVVTLLSRRDAILCSGASLVSVFTLSCGLRPSLVKAEESNQKSLEEEGDNGVIGAIKSLFDPNEKTKSGKVLPKSYLKAAREVVKTLRESLEEDAKDVAKFRRTADAAKESIRDYLNGWRGQQAVSAEESYAALERAIRSLANFYSKAGPFATLPAEVKKDILYDLNTADANL